MVNQRLQFFRSLFTVYAYILCHLYLKPILQFPRNLSRLLEVHTPTNSRHGEEPSLLKMIEARAHPMVVQRLTWIMWTTTTTTMRQSDNDGWKKNWRGGMFTLLRYLVRGYGSLIQANLRHTSSIPFFSLYSRCFRTTIPAFIALLSYLTIISA